MPADGASTGADSCGDRAASVVGRLRAGSRFRGILWLAETGSTNSDVMALARDGAPEGVVVVADHQTAGRGRRDRRWVAPSGTCLLVSVLLRPPADLVGCTGMVVGIAMAKAVEGLTGCAPGLKWPNDLVVEDRKLAGILCEADWPPGTTASGGWRRPYPGERLAAVAGIGVNVSWPTAEDATAIGEAEGERLPPEVAETATSLRQITGRTLERADLLAAFLDHLDDHYGEMFTTGSADAVLDGWRRRSATLGRRVRVDLGADDVEGTAVDVTAEGHLVVETLEGERRSFAVGDVVHLR